MDDDIAQGPPPKQLVPGVDRRRVKFEPTMRQRELVAMLTANRVPRPIIALILDIGERTLDRHFARETKYGAEHMVARVGVGVLRKALKGNMNAARYWLMTHGGPEWRLTKGDGAVEAALFAAQQPQGNPADGMSRRIHFYIPENGRDQPEDDEAPVIEAEIDEDAA